MKNFLENIDLKHIISITLLLILIILVRGSPLKDNTLPFGETDSAYHYSVADYIAHSDKSLTYVPEYIGFRYYVINPIKKLFTSTYPPFFHTSLAIFQSFASDRFSTFFFAISLFDALAVFSVYFLLSRLFNWKVGLLAGVLTIFGFRYQMSYLWGQWTSAAAIAFTPLILYSAYCFFKSLKEDKPKFVYMYFVTLLLGVNYLWHGLSFLSNSIILAVYGIIFIILNKNIPLKYIKNKTFLIQLGVNIIILTLMIAPFYYYTIGYKEDTPENQEKSSLFKWSDVILSGYPEVFGSYTYNYGYIVLALAIISILFLVISRKEESIPILAWVIGMYIYFHIDWLNITDRGYMARMLQAEELLFFSLAAIGLYYISIFITKSISQLKGKKMIIFFILAILLLINFYPKMAENYNTLKNSYQSILRLTPEQYEVAQWLEKNLDNNARVYTKGTLTYPKERFFQAAARIPIFPGNSEEEVKDQYDKLIIEGNKIHNLNYPLFEVTHVLIDYSDILRLANQPEYQKKVEELQEYEKNVSLRGNLILNKNNIHIYKLRKNGQ